VRACVRYNIEQLKGNREPTWPAPPDGSVYATYVVGGHRIGDWLEGMGVGCSSIGCDRRRTQQEKQAQ